jgi:mono/diheme cytochrome c family protein
MQQFAIAAVLGAALVSGPAAAADRQAEQFFETRVRPVLTEHCFSCHSAAGKKKGGLVVDSLAGLIKGGQSGAALVPGKPDDSLIIKAVRRTDESVSPMPPKGKLPDEAVAVLTEWVAKGAVWPGATAGGGKTAARPRGVITDEDRRWWAFQPLRNPPVPDAPAGADPAWTANPVDRFLLARLHAEGLKPSPAAERRSLIRRAYFDLIGLPPTPKEVEAFVADPAPDAYEKLIDRLLADPRYGERWARHWLDLVRYAESDGYRIDEYRPHAWRYRDYVIRSFNDDKPYDRFVAEQLAGDEIAPDDPDALTATGFLRLGIYEYNNRDVRTQWEVMLNDITDCVGDVFLGLGMGCARCHDHKFDPILQKDYYRLQAFFAAMQAYDDRPAATQQQIAEHGAKMRLWRQKAAGVLAEIEAVEAPARRRAEKDAVSKFPDDIQEILGKPEAERTPFEKQLGALAYRQVTYEFGRLDRRLTDDEKRRLVELRKQLAASDAGRPAPLPTVYSASDVGPVAPPTLIPKKGNTPVEPGFLTLLDEKPAAITPPEGLPTTGRRSALAAWINRPDNPLSHRVIVNRIWQYHFGKGLAANASDFGRLGEAPSHPDLLDWLASRWLADGRSFKKMHRLLMTSAAYRQSATAPAPEAALLKDPENRLVWKMPVRRLDAEQIRDAVLAVTGKLDAAAGGPSVPPTQPRRSVYTEIYRNSRDPLLDVFDAAEGIVSQPDRNVTTTPTQALLMINSRLMLDAAAALAGRVRREAKSGSAEDLTDAAYALMFGRRPTDEERFEAAAFLKRQEGRGPTGGGPVADLHFDKMPFRDGKAISLGRPGTPRMLVPESPKLPDGDFTVEAFVMLRSTYDTAAVRPIASHGTGERGKPGWAFGVTSKKSAFKPQMLVLQLWGNNAEGAADYEPIFSGLHIDLNKPYFVGVAVKVEDTGEAGITFYSKDLSNDDEPLQISRSKHRVVKIPAEGRGPLVLGQAAGSGSERMWDGLIDDVRLSRAALSAEQLLLTSEGVAEETAGYWQFEPAPGPMKDTTANGLDLRLRGAAAPAKKSPKADARGQALIDFCHVLLNANEFLYVE